MLGHSIVSQHSIESEGSILNSYPEPDQSIATGHNSEPHPSSTQLTYNVNFILPFYSPLSLFSKNVYFNILNAFLVSRILSS
jgi:hypothetical protein